MQRATRGNVIAPQAQKETQDPGLAPSREIHVSGAFARRRFLHGKPPSRSRRKKGFADAARIPARERSEAESCRSLFSGAARRRPSAFGWRLLPRRARPSGVRGEHEGRRAAPKRAEGFAGLGSVRAQGRGAGWLARRTEDAGRSGGRESRPQPSGAGFVSAVSPSLLPAAPSRVG